MSRIVKQIKDITRPIYGPIMKCYRKQKQLHFIKNDIERIKSEINSIPKSQPKLFYLGITAHSNLGDMAQYYCIHNWIQNNYPDHKHVEIEADTVVNEKYHFLEILKNEYSNQDIIVFQSGYTTQDLGGVHDLMHRMVIEALPNAHILMMPQTIYFKHEENKARSSRIYNQARNMLFLARDKVSYELAKEMMPDVNVKLYPDIVTSLIGKYHFAHERKGISLCRRNDGEKFYSNEELTALTNKFEELAPVTASDTTIGVSFKELRANPQKYIEQQIEYFSKFEVVVTDRYHGTIFALAAGTPVVIIKTNDHKVVTGADWFKGIYDNHIYVAKDLDDAYQIVTSIKKNQPDHSMRPIFASQYYDRLKDIFEKNSDV